MQVRRPLECEVPGDSLSGDGGRAQEGSPTSSDSWARSLEQAPVWDSLPASSEGEAQRSKGQEPGRAQ